MNANEIEKAALAGVRQGVESAALQFTVVRPHLEGGEKCLTAQPAEWRPPLWVRLLPFIPDLLTRRRLFVLAVTDRRVLIIRMTNPLFGDPKPNGVAASIPLSRLERPQVSGSGIVLREAGGKAHRFTNLPNGPEVFARRVEEARTAFAPQAGGQ